jgi:hypothetical protein
MDKTTYISIDVECTGHVPGLYSMISLGAGAFERDGTLLDKFLVNLKELPNSKQDPDTMSFWERNPIAYLRTKEDPVTPDLAMERFRKWFRKFENPVFVFMPQKFDGLFVYWYLQTFVRGMNFVTSPDAIDVKTMAMVALGEENPHLASKRSWKKEWKDKKHTHNHVAVDDAVEQGIQFIKILDDLKNSRKLLLSLVNPVQE